MPREIDDRKKRKALRKLRQAADRAQAEGGPGLSDWEQEFVEEVETRIETYGSAFADPEKGSLDEPLSALQSRKLKEIDKKSRGKASGLKRGKPMGQSRKPVSPPRVRDINEDAPAEPPPTAKPAAPRLVAVPSPGNPPGPSPTVRPAGGRPRLRLVRPEDDT